MQLADRMERLGTETAFEVLARAKELERQGRSIVRAFQLSEIAAGRRLKSAVEFPVNDPKYTSNQSKANNIRNILSGITNSAPPDVWLRVMYGIEVTGLPPQLAKVFSAPGGVLIASLSSTSKSNQAGLKVGDVIVKIGEDAVADPASFMQALSQANSDVRELLIVRGGKSMTVNLPK